MLEKAKIFERFYIKKYNNSIYFVALECPVPNINTATTKTDFDAADTAGRVMNTNYTLECLGGYAMLTQPDLTRSDVAVCTLDKTDETMPSVKWVYNNTQDQPHECKGSYKFT